MFITSSGVPAPAGQRQDAAASRGRFR